MLETFFLLLIFALGIFLIIKGGKYVVEVCANLSDYTGINETLIGATLTSLATTLPELILTILGMMQGSKSLVVGNGFGTLLVNICLVLGVSLTFSSLKRMKNSTILKILFVAILQAVLIILMCFKILNVFTGIVLMFVFVIYFVKSALDIKKDLVKKGKINEDEPFNTIKATKEKKLLATLKFIVGTMFIFAGAQIIINTTKEITNLFNISSTLIGLILVGVGTSLPELVASVTSIKKKRLNLAIGNVVGANIINLTLLFGLCGVFSGTSGIVLTKAKLLTIMPILLISSSMLAFPVAIKQRTYKWQGIILLLIYLMYCLITILLV